MIVGQKLPLLNFAYHVSREVVLYISHIGVCSPKAYRFLAAFWSENRCRLTLPILVWSRVWFLRELSGVIIIISVPNDKERKENMQIRNGF